MKLPLPTKSWELNFSVPIDVLDVPMVVVLYTRGDQKPGLIVGGVQQVLIENAEVHAAVKMFVDPEEFDPQTLLMFAQTARKALDAMVAGVEKRIQ